MGESEEAIFKQKYRLENKQRRARERASAKMCACVCARVRACLSVCVCEGVCAHDRRRAAPAAEPKIIWCARERPLPLPVASAALPPPSRVQPRIPAGGSGRDPVLRLWPKGMKA